MPEGDAAGETTRFVSAGLGLLGMEAGDQELAVIEAVDAIYRPPLKALIDAELDGVEPEPGIDLSRAPRMLDRR